MGVEELVMAELELVDLLYDLVSPLFVVLDLVAVGVGILSEAALAEETIVRTLELGAVVAALLLVRLALLLDPFAHVFQLVQGCQLLALHHPPPKTIIL